MFSWSKKKETKRRSRPDSEENEFGIKLDKGPSDKQLEAELRALAGVDGIPEDDLNLNEGEEDEEAELLRLIGSGKGKRPAKKAATQGETLGDISADITADIEDVGDEDVEVDENDPELLGELLELTQPDDAGEDEPESESDSESAAVPSGEGDVLGTLKERLKMYKAAEVKAKESHENSRARRFSRGIKTLEDLIKKAKGGKPVSSNDIPPIIAMNLKPAPPIPEAPPENTDNPDMENEGEEEEDSGMSSPPPPQPPSALSPDEALKTLMERLKLYETAEAKAKESGETTRARRFNRGIKAIQGLIKEAKAGRPVAPNDIPPEVALNLKPAPPPPPPEPEETVVDNIEDDNDEDEMENINLSRIPSNDSTQKEEEVERNIFDVLSERLDMYKTAEAKAKESGESTRARRFGRGIKTIQDLIKQATAGKLISPDDIPPPIALNLKPAPLVVQDEEEPRELAVESDTLVKSPNTPLGPPLKFSAIDDDEDDIDLDSELLEYSVAETVLEGLEQRVRIYTRLKEKAEEEGNNNLIDQNEKIINIYLNAIKTYKNGGYIDVLSLPAPKGAPPIPIPFQIP